MSETPDQRPATTPPAPATEAAAPEQRSNRLYQVAAWIAIVAGVMFIVAMIFFAGFVLGKASGDGHFRGHHQHRSAEVEHRMPMGPPHRPGQPMMTPPRMNPDLPTPSPGPGSRGPGSPGPERP